MLNQILLTSIINLIIGEDACDGDDGRENDSKVEVIIWGLLVGGGLEGYLVRFRNSGDCSISHLDAVGNKAEDGSKPEEHGKA